MASIRARSLAWYNKFFCGRNGNGWRFFWKLFSCASCSCCNYRLWRLFGGCVDPYTDHEIRERRWTRKFKDISHEVMNRGQEGIRDIETKVGRMSPRRSGEREAKSSEQYDL